MKNMKKRLTKKSESFLLKLLISTFKIQWIVKNKITEFTKKSKGNIIIVITVLAIFTKLLRIIVDNIKNIIYNNLGILIKLKS